MKRLALASLTLMCVIACMPHAARAGDACITTTVGTIGGSSGSSGGASICDELSNTPPIIIGGGTSTSPFAGVVDFTGSVDFFPGKVTIDGAMTFHHIDGVTDADVGSVSHFVVSDSSKGIVIFPATDPDGNIDPNDIVTPSTGFSAGPDGVVAADLDGDGRDDIVAVSEADSALSVMAGQSDGSFAPAVLVLLASSPDQFVLADIDGDGHPDLLVPDKAADALDVYLNDGHGGFSTPVAIAAGDHPISIIGVDVDGDGDVDLIVGDDDDTLSVLLNDGHGNFAMTSYPAGLHPDHVSFNAGVSLLDPTLSAGIVAWSDSAHTDASLEANGDGSFQPAVLHTEKDCTFGYSLNFTCTLNVTPVSTGDGSGGGTTSKPGKPPASASASGGAGGFSLLSLMLLGIAGLGRRFAR